MWMLVQMQTFVMYILSHMHGISCVHLICSSLNAHSQASLDPSHSICSLS